jgi:hypothetical protein
MATTPGPRPAHFGPGPCRPRIHRRLRHFLVDKQIVQQAVDDYVRSWDLAAEEAARAATESAATSST